MSADTQTSSWTAKQTYFLATVCLVVGTLVGYLAHAPKPTVPSANTIAPATVTVPISAQASSSQTPSSEEMKAASSQAAMPMLERLKIDPKNFNLLIAAGEMYYEHRAFTDAATFYKRALAIKDDIPVRNKYASALYYDGNADAALAQYAAVLKKNPGNDVALFNSGMICMKSKNDPEAAIAFWKRLLKASPNHPHRDQVEKMIQMAQQKN